MDTPEAIVSRLARLARLQFSPEETEHYAKEFRDIVSYVDQIESVQTSSVDMDMLNSDTSQTVDELRSDSVVPSDLADELIKQAPSRGGQDNRLVKVPPVFDRTSTPSL